MKSLKAPSHFWNVIFLILGLLLALISSWQLDIVAAGVIARYYRDVSSMKLWMPSIPPFGWQTTYWSFPDAYTRFFILMWVGFFVALMALWFWEEPEESTTKGDETGGE